MGMTVSILLAVVSALMVVVGVAFIYWPAALIVAGSGGLTVALLADFDPDKGD